MVYITLDDRQARIFAEATHEVAVRDSSGKHLGYITSGFTLDDLREAERRFDSDEPRYTTAQVLAHLKSLEDQCHASPSSGVEALKTSWPESGSPLPTADQ